MPELFKYSYRVLSYNLAAGLVDFEIPIDAEKVTYASPTDGPELLIRLQSKSNDQIPLRPYGDLQAPFQRLYLSASPVARTIFLLIGSPADIQLTGRDISVSGNISVIDSDESAVQAGQLFVGAHDLFPGANIAKAQLFNPVASGRSVLLYDCLVNMYIPTVAVGAANTYNRIRRFQNTTALPTLSIQGANMSLGGSAPLAELRDRINDLTNEAGAFADSTYPNGTLIRFPINALIPPGHGYGVQLTQTGINLSVEWRWKEF